MKSSEASPVDQLDRRHMAAALRLAARGLGCVAPNPAVGCVIVNNDVVVGRGWTQPGGRPHAESEALARAGEQARGATLYVSLEPCCHHGVTAPCADAILTAGVHRVVAAVADPDPRVAGGGLARLRAAGVDIIEGVLADEAAELNLGFFLKVREDRPLFTWKAATSLDGRIATRTGDAYWITGETARAHGHRLRADHDAVLVGSGTVETDNPELTCRLPGLSHRSPIRIVADGRLRLSLASRLVATSAQAPVWVLTREDADPARRHALTEAGVTVIDVETGVDGALDARAIARALAGRGLTRVLIEGGGQVAAAFLAADLIDRIAWFQAPCVVGGDGVAAAAPLGVDRIAAAPGFFRTGVWALGADLLHTYARRG